MYWFRFFYDTKCFYEITTLTPEESSNLPRIIFTDTIPYDPKHRVYSRKISRKIDIMDWKQRLGFAPDKVIKKTLEATTQLVPSLETEAKEIMRDRLKTRTPELKVRRVNDAMFADTFFASIKSVRGFKCWNLYCYQKSGIDIPCLQVHRSQGHVTLLSCLN